MTFKKATKFESKLRMAIAGPAGSGKTWTALLLATALADGGQVAVIDTEHGSASKYADDFEFDVEELTNFDPRNYIKAIHEAEKAGYAVLIIDSLSHAWNGTGGALELVEATAKKNQRKDADHPNKFSAWGEVTPIQNKMIEAILGSKIHVICTMRTKQEYVVGGDNKPRKLGMAPIQRTDIEYEFDIYADMDTDNTMIVQKSRCRPLSGKVIPKPGAKVAEILAKWLEGPKEPIAMMTVSPPQVVLDVIAPPAQEIMPASEQQIASINKLCGLLGKSVIAPDLSLDQAKEMIKMLTTEYKEMRATKQPTQLPASSGDPSEITVAHLRTRVNQIEPLDKDGGLLTLELLYASIMHKPYPGDNVVPVGERARLNRQLDVIAQVKAKAAS